MDWNALEQMKDPTHSLRSAKDQQGVKISQEMAARVASQETFEILSTFDKLSSRADTMSTNGNWESTQDKYKLPQW